MESGRRKSSLPVKENEINCPRCRSDHVHRIFPRWAQLKGLEMFECGSCGMKFYKDDAEDYRPTFDNRW